MIRLLAALVLPLLSSGCLSGTYNRIDIQRAPTEAELEPLVPGESDLAACLASLGAPLVVRELRDGAVLAWGGRKDRGWNVTLDIPVSGNDAAFSYSRDRRGLRGAVLFFDADWMLVRLDTGWLAEILPDEQARPQPIELIYE